MKKFKALDGVYVMRSYTMVSSQNGLTIAWRIFERSVQTRAGVATWKQTADSTDSLKGIDLSPAISGE